MSSYLVIARKWRPAVFDEIIGQDHVTKTLKNAISSGRVAQAYLFSGPRGVGKTTAARILAKCLNCTAESGLAPCNKCPSCLAITQGSSVDVIEIDGASNRGVEDMAELRENIMYMPAGGRRKIYIIDEVHMLSNHAFNALLKTLEEPPPHVVFIFATTEVKKIPLTILSRCQRFEFRRISVIKMEAHLKKILETEKIAFEEAALYAIAREADGSLRDAESLLDQVLAFGGESVRLVDVTEALGLMDRAVLLELMRAIVDKKGALSLNIIEKIYDFGYDLRKACGELLAIVRDMTAIRVTGGTAVIEAPPHELSALEDIAQGRTIEDLHMLFLLLQKGYESIARSAVARHAFEMTVLRAASFGSLRPIDELLKGLKTLESEGGAGARGRSVNNSTPCGQGVDVNAANTRGEVGSGKAARVLRGLPWEKTAPAAKKGPASLKGPDNFKNRADDLKKGPDNIKKGPHALEHSFGDSSLNVSDGSEKGQAGKEGNGARVKGALDSGDVPVGGLPGSGSSAVVMEVGASYTAGVGGEQNSAEAFEQNQGKAAPLTSRGSDAIEGLIGYVKEHENGALHSSLKASIIDLSNNRVEIKTDAQAFTFLEMKKARMEELFSAHLGGPVKVVLTARGAGRAEKKDAAKEVIRILGGKVLVDGYGDGG